MVCCCFAGSAFSRSPCTSIYLIRPGRHGARISPFGCIFSPRPLIVHPLIAAFRQGAILDTQTSLIVLGIFLVFGIISLVIDRRALLVSGLAYAGIALSALLRETGFAGIAGLTSATLLALGLFILLLSAGWQPLRNAILRLLPSTLTQRLPHPRTRLT